MTRRIDRVTELRRRDQPAITQRPADPAVEATTLEEVLGIPAGMRLDFNVVIHDDHADFGPFGKAGLQRVAISIEEQRHLGLIRE